MFGKLVVIAVLCITYTLAEAPVNRYRAQRLRQPPPRQFFGRQEAVPAPYPDSQGGEPAAEYGPPKPVYGAPTTPAPQYGPPPSNGDAEIPSESVNNPDSELVSGQPSRLQSLPQKKQQKFSQRLELQQQVQQYPQQYQQQQFITPVVSPFQQVVAAAPLQYAAAPVQYAAAPAQLAAIQQDGSYFIQLPNGSIQRVNYATQPSVVDNSVLAKLQFRPVAAVQATVAEPQLYVNTVVQSHVNSDE